MEPYSVVYSIICLSTLLESQQTSFTPVDSKDPLKYSRNS